MGKSSFYGFNTALLSPSCEHGTATDWSSRTVHVLRAAPSFIWPRLAPPQSHTKGHRCTASDHAPTPKLSRPLLTTLYKTCHHLRIHSGPLTSSVTSTRPRSNWPVWTDPSLFCSHCIIASTRAWKSPWPAEMAHTRLPTLRERHHWIPLYAKALDCYRHHADQHSRPVWGVHRAKS